MQVGARPYPALSPSPRVFGGGEGVSAPWTTGDGDDNNAGVSLSMAARCTGSTAVPAPGITDCVDDMLSGLWTSDGDGDGGGCGDGGNGISFCSAATGGKPTNRCRCSGSI